MIAGGPVFLVLDPRTMYTTQFKYLHIRTF
jgi:hypothetical protein